MRTLALVTFLSVCVHAVATISEPVRDWKQYPAIAEFTLPGYLYALGDVHGDYERLCELLTAAHLIAGKPERPAGARWMGEKAYLICTGDFIDKYDHGLEIIALFRALQPQAEKSGGRVIVTMGNHEASFLASGSEKKKSAEFGKELLAAGLSPAEVAAGHDSAGIGQWMRNLPIGAKAGDWFFCHAGNTSGRTLDQLRAELELNLSKQGFGAPILSDPNSMLEARLHPRQWWDASPDVDLKPAAPVSTPSEAGTASERRLRKVVEALGCRHLVCGHQPGAITFADSAVREKGRIFSQYNGLLFLIDTGMSRGQNSGHGALLKLHLEDAEHVVAGVIDADGRASPLWPAATP